MAANDTSASDLADLLPGRDIRIKGELLRILPLFFGQYPQAIKLIRPLATVLSGSGLFQLVQVGDKISFKVSQDWLAALPQVFEEGGEALMHFFAFCIGKPRKWFDDVPADEGFELASAIFEENKDFFVRRILPMLEKLGLKPALEGAAGDPSSQGSQATATAGLTSNG